MTAAVFHDLIPPKGVLLSASTATGGKPIVLAGATRGDTPPKFDLPHNMAERQFQAMLIHVTDAGASDVVIQSGDYVWSFWKRNWYPVTSRVLDSEEVSQCLTWLRGPEAVSKIAGGGEVDGGPEFLRHDVRDIVRFRLNAIGARIGKVANGISMTMRTIPSEIPALDGMNLPEEMRHDLLSKMQMKIIVGATGSGKTTLLASVLRERRVKESPAPRILCYEDPTEFAYLDLGIGHGPLVAQTEIGTHLQDWSRATPTAMRRKGDVILMGEVRDAESAEGTMEMAVTGHSVYATLHASTPQEAIYRIVEMFPPATRSAAAAKFLGAIRIVVAQKLVRFENGKVAALRSWLSFDRELKERLRHPDNPYPMWSHLVGQETERLDQTFEFACVPYIQSGDMDEDMFRDITEYGLKQSKERFAKIAAGGNGRIVHEDSREAA